MPRYYFHIRDASGVASDCEGSDFSDLNQARAEAHASACDLAAELLRAGTIGSGQTIEIADERGSVLETLAVVTCLE